MSTMRTDRPPVSKLRIALGAAREEKTSAEPASQYHVHPGVIGTWKTIVVRGAPELFNGRGHAGNDHAELIEQLYRKINQLELEANWLKRVS